jgi:hypothetical protein
MLQNIFGQYRAVEWYQDLAEWSKLPEIRRAIRRRNQQKRDRADVNQRIGDTAEPEAGHPAATVCRDNDEIGADCGSVVADRSGNTFRMCPSADWLKYGDRGRNRCLSHQSRPEAIQIRALVLAAEGV